MIDDMIDNRKADQEVLNCLERQMFTDRVNTYIDCLEMVDPGDPLIAEVIRTVHTYKIPLALFRTFAASMIHDIHHNGFGTFEEFLAYSEGASVAPASVFVHLCCLGRINGSYLAPSMNITELARPCAIFSYLVHIIRDFQKDQNNNLNYYPADVLKKYELLPSDLKDIASGAPVPASFRRMIREYCGHAESYRLQTLEQIKRLSTLIEPRYLLSLHIIYNLYLQVYERIDIENGSFTEQELNPRPYEIQQRVLKVLDENITLIAD
jgi:phytoene/squalene synthetase